MNQSNQLELHHAIKIDPDKCRACTHCLKVCPTEAIRIRNGKATIIPGRCVDCGECHRACPYQAFYVEQDDLSRIFDYKYRVALFPAVLVSQFPENISEEQIYSVLKQIGFTHTCEVEQPISVLIDSIKDFAQNEYDSEKPIISSFCPATVRLVQVKYPALTDHLVLRNAPHDLAAWYVRMRLAEEGIDPSDAGIFYITPCAAKIAAVKSPVGEKKSIVDGIINMSEIYNRVMSKATGANGAFHTCDCRHEISREGILWSLPEGEKAAFEGKSLSVDGMHNVIRILERLEDGDLPDIDFLELRACEEGCAGGIMMTGNRFLTADRQHKRAETFPKAQSSAGMEELAEKLRIAPVQPRPMVHLDTDMEKAFEKMQKARSIMCHLPGIDCGACGAPSCLALAEDMVRHEARMTDCIYVQQLWQKEGKISADKAFRNLEKKWGENRFDVDCSKRGAKNDNSHGLMNEEEDANLY